MVARTDKPAFKSIPEELRAQGLDAKANVEAKLDVHDIFIPGEGHPLDHPRRLDPLDADLLYDIAKRGVQEPAVLWREGIHGKKMRVTLLDGCQRVNHHVEACRRMKEGIPFAVYVDGKPTGAEEVIPWKEGRQYLPVIFHIGDIKSALLRRLGANSDPYKRPDSAAVLAAIVAQGKLLSCSDEELFAKMPREVDGPTYQGLCRYDDLSADAKRAFAEGAPIGLLAAIIDLPREEQGPSVAQFVAAGVKTKTGASRVRNREERAKGGGNGEAIRPSTIKRILKDVTPTEDEKTEAIEVYEQLREKDTQTAAKMVDAIETLMLSCFDAGASFRGGDLSAADILPDDVRRKVRKAAKEQGRTGEKKLRGKKSADE